MPSLFNALSSSLPTAVGNTLASVQQKVSEVGSLVANTFGGAGPLLKLQAFGNNIKQSASEVTTLAAQFSGSMTKQAAIDEMSKLAQTDPLNVNATTMLEAAKGLELNAPEVSAAQVEAAKQESDSDDSYKVRLYGIGKGDANYELIFDVMPEVYEQRSVSYEDVAPPQSIGAFQKFKGTDPVQWNVNATFVCRNIDEAAKNLAHLNQLRAWTMPFFGDNTKKTFSTRLGAPPPTLLFSGWKQKMVGPTRVVITSLNWTFPKDVDYIAARTEDGNIVPFPTVMNVAITLKESFSTEEFNNFDLNLFATGDIPGAYGFNDISDESGVVSSLNGGNSASEAAQNNQETAAPTQATTQQEQTTPPQPTPTEGEAGATTTIKTTETKVEGEKTVIKSTTETTTGGGSTTTESPPDKPDDQLSPEETVRQRHFLQQDLAAEQAQLQRYNEMSQRYQQRRDEALNLPDSDPEREKKIEAAEKMLSNIARSIMSTDQRIVSLQNRIAGLG